MIRIAHAWDCRVVAEGVEDAATVDLLRQMGCDVVQGFHILRPAPLAEVLGWVSNRGNRQDARVAEPDPARERVDGPVSPSRLGRRE